jgi:ABC-2 type transport system permease protein
MKLSRIFAIFIRQVYLIKSNPTRLVGLFLWVVLDIVQWGFISKYLGILGGATFSFATAVLGAVILWELMARIQTGIMTAFMEDIWSNNFINYFASPLKISEYVAGLVLTSMTTGVISFLLMLLIAGLGFGYHFFQIGLFLLPFIIILFIFGMAMGIFVSAAVFRLGPSAEWMAWPIPWLLSIFSGVFYPLSTLPGPLLAFAKIIPASYVFESLRSILAGNGFSPVLASNLLTGAILAVAYLLLMYFFFIRIYRRNLRNGSIARFSAEEI